MGKFKDADLTIKTIKLFPDLKKKLRKGTISTIETPAKKFVDIRSRVKKAGGYAMGGEATESLRKGQIFKEKRDKRRNEVDEMIERLYGPGIKSKKKPKNLDKIRPKTKPKKPQESIMLRKLAKELRKKKTAPKEKKKTRSLDDLMASFPKGRSAAAKRIGSKGVKSKGINIRAGKGNPAGKDLSIVGQIKRLMNPGSRNVGEPGLRQKGPRPPIKKIPPLNKKRGGSVKKKK